MLANGAVRVPFWYVIHLTCRFVFSVTVLYRLSKTALDFVAHSEDKLKPLSRYNFTLLEISSCYAHDYLTIQLVALFS